MIKNHGLNWKKEIADQSAEDWIFGVYTQGKLGKYNEKCIAEILPSERQYYLPVGEPQYSDKSDMYDCTTRGVNNILETKLNFLVKNNKLSQNSVNFLKQFENNKGDIEISDAFTSIKSGNTQEGNSMKAPLDSARKNGIVPKKLMPLEKWMTWQDYHNPNRITKEIEAIGKESLKYFNFNYERVLEKDIKDLLRRDVLDLAGFAWSEPENGIYPRSPEDPNHVFMGLKNANDLAEYIKSDTDIFDNYLDEGKAGDFIKRLAWNYDFAGQYRIIISEILTQEEEIKQLTTIASLLQDIIIVYQKIIDIISKKVRGFFKGRK